MPEKISVIEFTTGTAPPYRVGERAGFAPDVARFYVARGVARIVAEDVHEVDPLVHAFDARRKAQELRMLAQAYEEEGNFHEAEVSRLGGDAPQPDEPARPFRRRGR